MMKKLLICMLLVATPAFAIDGNKLKEYMLASEANTNASVLIDVAKSGYGAGAYYGYVTGVGDATHEWLWCPREGVTYGQVMAVVAKYLRDHPERLHLEAATLVVDASREAFPCPKK